jgi:hypothetical protein
LIDWLPITYISILCAPGMGLLSQDSQNIPDYVEFLSKSLW